MSKNNDRKLIKQRIGRYLTSLVILGSAMAATVAMSLARKAPEEATNVDLLQKVDVFTARDFTGQLEIEVSGLVDVHREIEMAAQVSGQILEKSDSCRAGNYVTENTLLIKIDSTNYELARRQAEAEKAQAEASILELEQELENLDVTLELAEREFRLQEQEFARKQKAGSALSASERDEAVRTITTAERSLTELKNTRRLTETRRTRLQTSIELSKVRLEEARVNIQRCEIRAPFDGLIVTDTVEKGDYVPTGSTVIVLEDTSKTDVKCNLRFEQLVKILKYQVPDSRYTQDPMMAYQLPPTPVSVRREGIDGQPMTWDGTLVRYDGIGVDATTKMVPCRIEVEEPVIIENGQPKALRRNMYVTVTIPLNPTPDEGQSLLTFPTIAIRPGGYVWAVLDGKLNRIKVEVLDRKNEDDPDPRNRMVVVRTDSDLLKAGAKVVTSPLAQPYPGTEVQILNEIEMTSATTGTMDAKVDTSPRPASLPANSTRTTTDDADPSNPREAKGTVRS